MFHQDNEIVGNAWERKWGKNNRALLDYAGINLEAIKLNVTPI